MCIRAGPQSKGRRWPGLINHIFFYITWMTGCVSLTWGTNSTRMHYGKKSSRKRQCDALDNALLGTLGPAIHVEVTLTCTTYLIVFTDHVQPFIGMTFPDLCGLFQQDNLLFHKAKILQQWFEEHYSEYEEYEVSKPPDLNPIEHLRWVRGVRAAKRRPTQYTVGQVVKMLCLLSVYILYKTNCIRNIIRKLKQCSYRNRNKTNNKPWKKHMGLVTMETRGQDKNSKDVCLFASILWFHDPTV